MTAAWSRIFALSRPRRSHLHRARRPENATWPPPANPQVLTVIPAGPLFPTRRGKPLSRDAIAERVALCAERAAQRCPSLSEKTVTPHVLRHTAAMRLLHSGIDITVIALWLGHEGINTTQAYVHADMSLKQRALDRTIPVGGSPGCYRAPDHLLAFLDSL